MLQQVYCIYDIKSRSIVRGVLQCFSNDEDASRFFSDIVTSPEAGLIHKHPADFSLMSVGQIDFDNLIFEPNSGSLARPVITGDACVRAVERARAELAAAQDAAKAAGIL